MPKRNTEPCRGDDGESCSMEGLFVSFLCQEDETLRTALDGVDRDDVDVVWGSVGVISGITFSRHRPSMAK